MVEILDLLLFKGNTPERTCPINTGDQPANEQRKPSVGNHFFQTLQNGKWTETSTRQNEIELAMFDE